jgi:hypothetical protein
MSSAEMKERNLKKSTGKKAGSAYICPQVELLRDNYVVPTSFEIPDGFAYEILPLCGNRWGFIQIPVSQLHLRK